MKLRGRIRLSMATILTLTMMAAVPSTVAATERSQSGDKRQLTVMTQNLYLGSSLNQAIAATSASDFVTAVAQIYGTTVATSFPRRAEAIAETIAVEEPDLIGLQEVSRWIAQPTAGGPTPRSYDFLAILRAELAERRLDYRVEAVAENASIGPVPLVAPAFGCTTVTPSPSCVVTLQDRDVILVNNDTRRLRVRESRSGHYAAQEVLQLSNGPATSFARGWAYINGSFAGKKFRFVNTHLEVERYAATQEAQAQEFLAGPARARRAVIAVGDFNSAADPAQESTTTYEQLIAASFKDAWQVTNPDDPGATCCQNSTLTNTTSQLRTRIDLVLTRGPVRAKAADVVGAAPISAATPPFWASDHAGVVATVRLR
jgi:endonuclease/exonuclease/phosphatase family metal-dependent hydrolase